jgi:tRNA threonylcarbamoyladenosine biosynthesis protein TsaB
MNAVLTLAIEASTSAGSVAVLRGDELLAQREVVMRASAGEQLLPAIDAVLGEVGATTRELGCLVCGAGPGSFTSLRVAASLAKGIASAHSLPLYAVPSLALIAGDPELADGRYLTVLDALRDELYAAAYQRKGDEVTQLARVRLIARAALPRAAERLRAKIIGPEEKPRTFPRAANAVRLGAWLGRKPVQLASWEPDYGRLAEAQVTWERAHGRRLSVG